MKRFNLPGGGVGFAVLVLCLMAGCANRHGPLSSSASLADVRRGFKTTLRPSKEPKDPVEKAPPSVFRTVTYFSAPGKLSAYLSPDPGDHKKHPAIIWITGGDCNSIGDVWTPAPRNNDQTAAAYRKAGIVMLFPSLRGGNTNPGVKEGFLGEVDDVLAAAKYLEKQPYVDPKRIYLGGHSTGGTLALLVSECSSRFRTVFSFGPVGDVGGYGDNSGFLPFNTANRQEVKLRSPGYWLASIHSPVWVFEGIDGQSNIRSVRAMAKISTSHQVNFVGVNGANHFSVLAPMNELIARKIVGDTGTTTNITFPINEISQSFAR